MKPLISPKVMRECEAAWFRRTGVPSLAIMERAAEALAACVRENAPAGSSVFIACGTGGNGGDGLALARLLADDYRCLAVAPGPPAHPDAVTNLGRALKAGVAVAERAPGERPDVWVDALLGTGLSRAPEGAAAALIRRMNGDRRLGSFVIAADIPSGLDGATGRAYPDCIAADVTVTFHRIKTGLVLADGLDARGRLATADVSFDGGSFGPDDALLLEAEDLARHLPPRSRNVHKGSLGHLLIVAGSRRMAGASALCAMGALRSGVGLVTVACPASIMPVLQGLAPQAVYVPLDERDGVLSDAAARQLEPVFAGKTAAAVGCGLGRMASPEVVRAVLESGLPAAVDADALNIISDHPRLSRLLRPCHVLTPHPGEAARLPREASPEAEPMGGLFAQDPLRRARALAGLGAAVLLKGASTVIVGGDEAYVSASGCSGMARGGSGDILTGILGAFLAEPSDRTPALSAALASEVHGLAGERAQARYGSRGMNARDILEFLPEVLPR